MNGPLAGRLSLGAQSQLLAARFEGEFVDHGDWLVVRNAANPTWYWGNFLLTTAPPLDADLPLWLDRNAQAIGARQPESDHVALWVDAPVAADALPAWRGAGFEFNAVTALQLETGRILAVPLPRIDSMRIRSLRLPEEADAAVDLQALSDHGYEPEGYRRFRAHAMARVSRMHAQGIAHWFGVFAGPQLVADCGLVVDARPGRPGPLPGRRDAPRVAPPRRLPGAGSPRLPVRVRDARHGASGHVRRPGRRRDRHLSLGRLP